jgi:membrane fusion protein, copper/silver efflux system
MSEEKKANMPREAVDGSAGGEQGGDPVKPAGRRRIRASHAAAAALMLVSLLVLAFFTVPAFHALLHPHSDGGGSGGPQAREAEQYTCPMHPFIVSDRPGACPICGMTLVPQESMAMQGTPSDEEARAIGMVAMNPTQRLMANVATERVERREFTLDTFAVGRVTWDERKVSRVSARIGGRIERLHVDFTGTRVVKGQPLLDIYSPELISTQREYLLALAGLERMRESPYEDVREMSSGLVSASRTRLKLWGITDGQIAELERSKEPRIVFPVYAPASGIVTERLVTAGQYVAEGTPLYSIADPGGVWVQADLYETEIHKVPVGTPAVITTEAYPGREFRGKVSFVDPFLNPATRTLQVRVELPNPGNLLKPEMFVRAVFRGKKGAALALPESAVLITGERAVTWIEVSPNTFEPRMVRVGHKANGYYEVLEGLTDDETVVTSAGFLIDSESQLRSGSADPHAGHGGMDGTGEPPPAVPAPSPLEGDPTDPHAGHGTR